MNFQSVEPATGVWCLASGHAVNPSWRLGRDFHVAHGPESRHHTPSATEVLTEHFNGNTIGVSRAGVGTDCQDRERQGRRDRADMDVLVASPGSQYPPLLPTPLIIKWDSSGSVAFVASNVSGPSILTVPLRYPVLFVLYSMGIEFRITIGEKTNQNTSRTTGFSYIFTAYNRLYLRARC